MGQMELSRISPKVTMWFSKQQSDFACFSSSSCDSSKIPDEFQSKKQVLGIVLDYAFTGKQDGGAKELSNIFKVDEDFRIHKVPTDLSVTQEGEYFVLKISNNEIDFNNKHFKETIDKSFLIGYWTSKDLIFISTKEFKYLLDSILELLKKKKKTRLYSRMSGFGPALAISSFE